MAALLPLGHNPRVAEPLCALSLVRSELPTAVPGQHMAKEKCSSQRGVKNIDLGYFCFVFLQAAPFGTCYYLPTISSRPAPKHSRAMEVSETNKGMPGAFHLK